MGDNETRVIMINILLITVSKGDENLVSDLGVGGGGGGVIQRASKDILLFGSSPPQYLPELLASAL